ncbi:hypothetical protein Aperf_G00000043161 [Anoplocephala perfoliata]
MGAVPPSTANHLRSIWLNKLTLAILLLLLTPACYALPHFYQVNMRLRANSPLLELRCPLYQAMPGDVLVFSDMNNKELMRVELQETLPAPILALSIDSLDKGARTFVYLCRVFESKTNSLVSKTTFIIQKQLIPGSKVNVYETFHYDPSKVTIIKAQIGRTLKLECPLKTGNHVWFRAGGEVILNPETKEHTGVLNITSVKTSDLGTYYCGSQELGTNEDEKLSVGLLLSVKKFVLMASGNSVLTRLANVNASADHLAVQSCGDVVKDLTFSDMVSWERPLGTVHLIHGGKRQLNLKSITSGAEQPLHCSLEGHTIQRILTPNNVPLFRSRRSIMKPQFVLRGLGEGGRTALVECRGEANENMRYEWAEENQGVVGTESLQEIPLFGVLVRERGIEPGLVSRYTCTVSDAVSGEKLGESTFNALTKIKQPDLNSVELSEDEEEIVVVYPDEALEMHCDIPASAPFRGRDIVWWINGEKLGPVPDRVDMGKSSILGFPSMSSNKTGTYSCRFGETTKTIHVIVRDRAVTINIEPKEDYKSSGINDMVEFHCRVTGLKNGGKSVLWSFIPDGATEEQEIPSDVGTSSPSAAPATAFLFIENPVKRHEGQYICRIGQAMDVGKLIVEERKISVNPETVTTRLGSTVRFFCSLTLADGKAPKSGVTKVSWIRKDRRALLSGREEILSGTSVNNAAVLVVKNVDDNFNNVEYICTDGFREAQAKILIQEVCGPGERSCGGDKCIPESLFCNGVPDCPDGSDEIPERCRECDPNQYACLALDGKEPSKFCYLRSWHCDGEDDCGNGYDESNCPPPNPNTPCSNRYYICPDDQRPIPRSYLCDTQTDCEPSASDEVECSRPSVIYPPRGQDVVGINGTNVTLKCVVHGRPPASINWRFNWGPIKADVNYVENTTIEGCDRVTSYLTLVDIDPRASGMYTCEAVTYQYRVLAPDYTVNVGAGSYCSQPKFNDAAWNEDMCLNCYCSGVSDDCKSLRGYFLAPMDKMAKNSIEDVRLVQYDKDDNPMVGELPGLQLTDSTFTVAVPNAENTYLEGKFGLTGDWTQSYSLYLKSNITIIGKMEGYRPFAAVVLEGNGEKLYYCGLSTQPVLYTDPTGYQNQKYIRLTERDGWMAGGPECDEKARPSTRERMMKVLANVEKIRFRVNFYDNQETYKLESLQLEHAIPTDAPGALYPEIESCKCPEGYKGLSCQRCERGFEHDPDDPTKCRPACSCEKCDEQGNCIACPDNAAGPDCSECKIGFFRPLGQPVTSPCLPCEKCGGGFPYVNKACSADSTSPDGYRCRCEVRGDGRLLDESCDLCKTEEVPPPEAKCDERSELLNLCNPLGTESITSNEICNCKVGYEGEQCRECANGFMKHGNKCLPCYCAGKTKSCKGSETHFFENISLADPGRYKFDISLARKSASGELYSIPLDDEGKKRIERVYARSNVDKLGLPGDLIIREPLVSDGISRISIKLSDLRRGPTDPDMPLYRYLYGGKISFQFKRIQDEGTKATTRDNQLFVVIDSPKFGSYQALAAFNPINQRYEVEFSEDWWNGGWRAQNQELSRATLLRVLGTANSIAISAVTNNNDLENARISGLSLQIARDFGDSPSEGLPSAPVEVCECETSGGRSLSPSCEGCTDLTKSTAVRLELSGPDFQCGECIEPYCDPCPAGKFKYDFLTNTVYDTCQKGVEFDTEGRVVVARPGSRVELACRATSYRGGIPVHTWRLPAQLADSKDFTIRRELLPFKPRSRNGTWSPITSESQLSINNVKEEYSGLYECQVAALGANLTEPFYLIIRDPAKDLPVEPGDTLNEEYPVPLPVPEAPPVAEYISADKDKSDPEVAVVEGKISPPESLDDFHIVWLAPNGTQITPVDAPEITRLTGEFKIRLPVDLDELDRNGEKIQGFLVGKDPIKTPIWVPLPEPTRIREPATLEDIPRVSLNYPSLNLSFLEPGKIMVIFPDGKPKNAIIKWQRLGSPPLDSSEFPDGIGIDRYGNLVVYAAGEEHEGTYEATITFPETGKAVKLQSKISVEPWLSPAKIEVPPGKAGESPEEVKNVEPPQPTDEEAFIYYVTGFTPDSAYCESPRWTLVDKVRNTSKDITERSKIHITEKSTRRYRINRENNARFVINYPLSSGKYIKFECLPVPATNLSGSLHFNIDSPDVRVILIPIYDDLYSIFPTRLLCAEGNPHIEANVSITSDSLSEKEIKAMEKPKDEVTEEIELDWRRVGGFQPSKHAVKYMCNVKTPTETVQKSIIITPRRPPEHLDLAERPTTPKMKVSSPGRVLVPTGEDQYRLDVREGETFEVVAEYDAPSDEGEITWALDESGDVPEITADGGHSWKRVKVTDIPTLFDNKILNFTIKTPEGEKTAKVTFAVAPSDRLFVVANLNSSSLINGDLIGLTNGSMEIDVKVTSPDGSEISKDLETFWRITRANGAPITLDDGVLAQRYTQPNPSRLELQGLPSEPTEFRISAAVLVPAGDKKEVFTSVPYRLVIREGLIKAFVEGLTEPGVLSGPEFGTVGASCVARDIWRNDTLEGVTYEWDYLVLPEGTGAETPTSTDKIVPDEATQSKLPWHALTFQDNAIYMGSIRSRPGWSTYIRCRAKTATSDKPVVSEWFKLNVIPGDIVAKFPKIEIRPTFDLNVSRFPMKVECVDTNTEVPSTVTWTKDGQSLPSSVKVENKVNTATLSWSVGGSNEFSPRDLAGTYTCEAKNEFRTVTERLFLPSDIMEKPDVAKVPIDKEYIRIKSTHQPIEEINGQQHVTVDEGEKFELVCEYYGNPAPTGGVSWRLVHDGGEGSTNDALAKVNGLAWERGRNYWALVQSDAFNKHAPQTGIYTCEALDQSGNALASVPVTVDVPEKEYDVKVLGLNNFGVLQLQPGGSGSVECHITDLKTGEVVPTYGRLKKVEWEGPMVESADIKSLTDLAQNVHSIGRVLSFQGVHADLPEIMKGKCVFSDGKVRKDSDPFLIVVKGEGGTDGKIKAIVEEIPSSLPNERRFQCNAFDTLKGQRIEDATMSWYFLTPLDETVHPSHLFEEVRREGNTITLSDLRKDTSIYALSRGFSTVEGRCFAYVPETGKVYTSGVFMTLEAEEPGQNAREIKDPKPKDTPYLNIEGDHKGEVPFEEGADASLKCRIEEASPDSPKFKEGYTYLWQISRKDELPMDTSAVARNIELIPLPDGGLELKLTGLKQSASGLEVKCIVLNQTDKSQSQIVDFPGGYDSVKFVDSRPAQPDERPHFTGMPEYETISETDKRNKYIVKFDGLDDSGKLAAPLGSNKTIRVKVFDKETGEELTLGDSVWRAAGIEVQHRDGRPAPISHIAKEIHVDSDTGEIRLVDFKGDSELPKAGDLFVRAVVEKTPSTPGADKELNPGQLGDPTKERYASLPIPVSVADREEPDNRESAVTSPPLTPAIHGLSKCRTLALQAGKNATLSCTVGGEDGILYAWEFRTPKGQVVSSSKVAEFVTSSGNLLTLRNMKTLAEGEILLGRCVVGKKRAGSEKFYSRYFLVGPQCGPVENEVVRVEELKPKNPDQREFRCVVTRRDDGSVIPDAIYNWEFSTPSGEVILPGHLFESVEMYNDRVVLGKLRSDVDISKYFGDHPNVIEGRCVAVLPPEKGKDEPKKVVSDPMVKVSGVPQNGPQYSTDEVIEDSKPRVDVIGTDNGKMIAKPDETVTLKCLGFNDQTGSYPSDIEYSWEVQTKDRRPIDSSALAEKVELMPASNGFGFELKLTKVRQSADGLRLRCVVIGAGDKDKEDVGVLPEGTLAPDEQASGDFIDVVIEKDPSEPDIDKIKLEDIAPTPDDDPRKPFRVKIDGLDPNGNLAGLENSTVMIKAELIDEFTNEKAETPLDGEIIFGLEATNSDGSPASLNRIADSVEIDGKTGEIRFNNFKADRLDPVTRDLRIRVVAERSGRGKRQRFASAYIYPVLTQDGGEPVEDKRPVVKEWRELKPMIVGLSECRNSPIEVGGQKTLVCNITSPDNNLDKLLYGWELRDESGNEIPFSGSVADFAKQFGNKLELIGLFKPSTRVYGRCVVARPSGGSSKYYSDYFEVGAECEPTPESLVKVDVQDIPRRNPNEKVFECFAYDAGSGIRLNNATFSWRFRSVETGEIIPPGLLFGKVTTEGNRVILTSLNVDVDLESLSGSNKVYGECIADVPRSVDGFSRDIYSSGPKFFLQRDPSGNFEIGDVKEFEKPKVQFQMEGIEDGMVKANEGDNRVISCVAVDPETRRPIEGLAVQWVVEYRDGTLVDTSTLAKTVRSMPLPSGAALRLQEIYKTASGLRAKCIAVNVNRGLNWKPGQQEGPIDPKVEVKSMYVTFDVTPKTAETEEEKVVPRPELLIPRDFKFVIDGLDENGSLAITLGSDKELTVRLVDKETDEDLPKDPRVKYGVELRRANKLPAALGVLAKTVEMNSADGKLKIEDYRGDTLSDKADDLFLRFTVERPSPSGDGTFEKFGSQSIPVKTLDISGELVPDNRKVAIRLPDLMPVVLGLSACSNLVYDEGVNVTLKCKARGLSEDDDSLIYAWELIKPGGIKLSMAGKLAKSVEQEGSKLRLLGMRKQKELLYGRCLVARKVGNGARYGSYYFRIGGNCESQSKVITEVDEIRMPSSHDRKFKCKTIDSESRQPIQAGNFQWEFVTSSGEIVLPSHIFSKVEIDGDTIQLSRPVPGLDLSKYLGPNDGKYIMGRCRVISSEDGDESEQPFVPPSDPFIAITDNKGIVDILEPVDIKDEKPKVVVKGAGDDRVNRNEAESVTLTCQAQDVFSSRKLNGLKYAWEIRTNDNRPIDTSALADKVEMLPTGEIKLSGLKQSADALRARCILINDTTASEGAGLDKGPLSAGESKPGELINFNVKPDPSSPLMFNHTKLLDIDETEPPKFKVAVEGLDENGALASKEGDEVTIRGKLINAETNEEETNNVRFGIEASYVDGSPAPLGILGDTISVDAQTGEIKLNGFKGDKMAPQRESLRVRVVAERTDEFGEPAKPMIVRYASKYIPVVTLGPDGTPAKDDRPTPEKFDPVSPTISGLSPCGNLFLQPDYPVSVYCKATNKSEVEDQFIYGWELFNAKGDPIPLVGVLSSSAVIEGSGLHLVDAKNPPSTVFGRCVVSRKAGDDTRYFSQFFQVGGECEQAVLITTRPTTTTTTTRAPPKEGSTKVPAEGEEKGPQFTDTIKEDDTRIRFQITGINSDRLVIAKPGENATLTCTAYNADTNEILPDATVSWEFSDLERNKISPMRIANKVVVQGRNAINFIELREEPRVGGHCLITLADKATISTPFFYFHVTKDEKAPPLIDQLPDSEKPIDVLVEGLNEKGQIAVRQIGDDVQLTCKAQRSETKEIITDNVRYGWEWRYLDNDPAMTSNLAVGIKTDGDSMELRGIRAPEGLGGRGIKGRCVLHVPSRVVDPESPDGDKERKFSSPYFMVVVDRVPTITQPPVPGHEIDGISVEIDGAPNAELKASQGSDAKLDCVVKNTTSGKPVSPALYAIVYGWEFRDASGDAVDSSFFAKAVNVEPFGSLKLSGLSAPPTGRFPMRIRCYATLARRLPVSAADVPQPKYYTSDYVGLLIVRDDGTVTGPQPGQPEPDLQGKLVDIAVGGLHPSGDLKGLPGENVELTCIATDKKTNQRIPSDKAIYDWSLVQPNGHKLSNGQVADEVFFEGPHLMLKHVRVLEPALQGSMGRCEVFYNGQTYTSPFFKLDFTPKSDGVLVVDIDGVNKILGVIELTPEEKTLQSFAVDSKTRRPETDVTYAWEYHLSSEGLPDLPNVMDTERVETFKEGLNGKLILKGTENAKPPKDRVMRLRSRVTKDGRSYTSPFYTIRLAGEEIESEKPEEKPVPKYWAKISGLDDQGRASANPGEDLKLGCQAMVTETGEEATDVDYLWEVRSTDGRLVDVARLGVGGVNFGDKELTISKVNPSYGTIKGRCVVVDRLSKEHSPSPFFTFAVPPKYDSKDAEKMPPLIKDASPRDHRLKVWVSELNDLGNLNGLVGNDAALKCNAESQVPNADVIGYSWEFIDEYAQLLSPSVLAKEVQVSADGSLQMNGLRAYKDRQGYHAVTGRCFASARITETDGRVEELRFPSKYFHIVIRDIEDPFLPKIPEDSQGEFVIVNVDGLDEHGNLKAEPGDSVTLTCKAKDIEANIDDVEGSMAWSFTDSLGREVPADRLAMSVERLDRQLVLTYLRPTSENVITRGKCVVFSAKRKRIYSSIPFDGWLMHICNILEDDEVVVEVSGDVADNAFTGTKGGDGNLICTAKNRTMDQALSPDDVSYGWEFEINGQWKPLDRVAGEIAANVMQFTDPNNPQAVILQLRGLSSVTKWTRARCSVIAKEKPPRKVYFSPPFTSGKAFDPTTLDRQFAGDPNVSIRVHGLDEDNSVIAKEGEDRVLKCFAIDMNTGLPIEQAQFTWDLRTVDDQPLITNRLAQQVLAADGKLQLLGLKSSSKNARARCLATIPERDETQEGEPKKKLPFHSSAIVKFQVAPQAMDTKPTEPKIDISNLRVEVVGISPAGSLTDIEGENRTLDCIVTNKYTGAPIVEDISVGWVLATGPDNQPFELSRLADNVKFEESKLKLSGLRRTGKYSGGLRGQCVVYAEGGDALEVPMVKSDVFTIHISPRPTVDLEKPEEPEDEKDKGLPDQWIPGPVYHLIASNSDPKDAVAVIVHELNRDGEFEGNVGADATLTCVAHDTKTQEQLKVGDSSDKIHPRFGWELRDANTGEELSFNQLVSGQVTVTQTSQGVDMPDASAASRLRLEGLLSTVGKSLHGRCTVSLNGQRYRSAYFPISIGGKRVPGSVVNVDDIPGYYESDNAVAVVVSDLDTDGGKVVYSGENARLTCTAMNAKSKIPLPEKSVFYGWRLVDAGGQELPPERLESVKAEGNSLTLTKVSYATSEGGTAEPIYGWCIAGVKQPTGLPGLLHYRSNTFIIHPNGEQAGEPVIPDKPDIKVSVTNFGGDEDFLIRAGEDIEMRAIVTDAKTGEKLAADKVKIGWEWTDVSGARPINLGEFAAGGEELTSEGAYNAYEVRLPQPVRGRAVVVYSMPEEGKEWHYSSPYFFLSPDREGKEPPKEIPFDEAIDKSVIFKITGLDEKNQLVVPTDGVGSITVEAQDAASGMPLTKDTDPALVGYGWDVVKPNTLPTHSGNLADQIKMDSTSGKLSITNLKADGQKVLLRMTALVETNRTVGEETVTVRRRYKSDPIPLVSKTDDTWPEESGMDITGKGVIVSIDGLDEEGKLVVNPGESAELKAVVKDASGADVQVNGYSWMFIDRNGFPVAPSLISKSAEESPVGSLKLSVIQPSALADGVHGRCRVAVEREGAKGLQYYDSPWFDFKSPVGEETGKTEGTEKPVEEQDYGFTLKIKSESSVLFPRKEGDIVMARPHLPLELNCMAEFAEGVSPRLSESGVPIPQLSWYYRRPELLGDVPIPAELYRVDPGKLQTLLISQVDDHTIRISSDHYDFRDDVAEFQCHAMDGDKLLMKQTVFINRVKERIRVQVFDEKSRTAVYALENSKSTLSCYVEDEIYGGRVDPLSYKWEIKQSKQGWDENINSGEIATAITGAKSKDLVLDGLLVSKDDEVSSSYQIRCVAQYNETYFVVSRGYAVNVHRTPEMKAIRLIREKPEQQELTGEPAKDIYDASSDYLVTCKPDFFAGETHSVWEKYNEEFEEWEMISPPLDQLFFENDSTEYEDEGQYRCRVSHDLQDYDYHVVKTRVLELRRIAGPAPSTKSQQVVTANQQLMLQCSDHSASPQVEVSWLFKPSGEAPPEGKDPLSLGSYFQYGRNNIFLIPAGQLLESHSGIYTCTRTNEYGQATTEISVTVKPLVYETTYRAS